MVALDAATGEQLWMHSEHEGARGAAAPRQFSGRGLAYWTDGTEERILYVTPGYRLVALDAKTGMRVPGFGNAGVVDLKEGLDQIVDPMSGEIGLHAAPVVARNVVIVGAAGRSGGVPTGRTNVKGFVRGFDVRTGKRLWIFHTIPEPGEFGNDTWEKDSWSYTGNTGVWAQISVDEELGLVYLPIEVSTGDYFGGPRPGNNLFSESLVAVDLQTGQRRWHYQLVHHGIWDMDIPCAPILVDITVDGRPIKAVAQPTKQAFLYVLNRVTGEPVWPILEQPVEKGTVPGEWYSPTQPFPTRPPAYDRQGFTMDDLIDFTPELRAEAAQMVSRYKLGPVFTPPVVSRMDGPLATLAMATAGGGTNWPGGSFDPETQTLYVSSNRNVSQLGLVPPRPETKNDLPYVQGNAASGARTTGGSGSAAFGGRRRRRPAHRPRAAHREATLRADQRHRPEAWRDCVAGRARRNARHYPEPPGARGCDHPAHGTAWDSRHAGHQDGRHRGRVGLRTHTFRRTRRDASGLRQGHRSGGRRRVHARPANRVADDVHVERASAHRRRRGRRRLQR